MKKSALPFVICLAAFSFNSCQKSEDSKIDDESVLSILETQTDEVLSDVDIVVNEAIKQYSSLKRSESAIFYEDCPVIKKDSTKKVMTIDFGSSCTGKDGKIRSGKIIVTSESFRANPSVRDKTFDNYYVDEKKIDGSVVKTILKDTANNIRTATIHEDITISFPDSEVSAHRTADLTRQYYLNETGNENDQVISWGTTEFTRTNGVIVTKNIVAENPLVYSATCNHIVSGLVSFTNSKNISWTIDYGNGDCDDKAILTKNGISKEIIIK